MRWSCRDLEVVVLNLPRCVGNKGAGEILFVGEPMTKEMVCFSRLVSE